jgi:branched-chain amino acid aminotransferase
MIVLLNGQFVPEEQAVISVFDRGFLYGDGLFETLRVFNGKPFRWAQHMERLHQGAEFLKIPLPFTPERLRDFASQLVARNSMPDSLLRLTLSRGIGVRGYSPKGAESPALVMSLHPAPALDASNPPRWRLITSSSRLPANEPLARFKTCNKLPQILARSEADSVNADEALLLNTNGHVVEAASSNLFWIENGTICTPPLPSGILPGVTRAVVLEVCSRIGLEAREASVRLEQLRHAEGVFLSLSTVGIAESISLDGVSLAHSPLVDKLHAAYWKLLHRETA